MPFPIMLMAADLNAPLPSYEVVVKASVHANGGRFAHRVARLADGGEFAFDGNDLWARQLTGDVCRVVFDTALRTNSYVSTAGSEATPLKIAGTTLAIPPELGRPAVVSSPDALCGKLRSRQARWNRDMGKLRREGVVDADGQPLQPPADPGKEPRVAHDRSGIAADCEEAEGKMNLPLGWKLVRRVVTRNTQWGVIWRADIATDPDPNMWMRETCWRSQHGRQGLNFSSQPLTMFDPSQSVAPLPAEKR